MMRGLQFEVAGEAADWPTTLEQAPLSGAEMILVDWDLLPGFPGAALDDLREICPANVAIVLLSRFDARQQAALSTGADTFISKCESADRVADRCLAVAARVRSVGEPVELELPAYRQEREIV